MRRHSVILFLLFTLIIFPVNIQIKLIINKGEATKFTLENKIDNIKALSLGVNYPLKSYRSMFSSDLFLNSNRSISACESRYENFLDLNDRHFTHYNRGSRQSKWPLALKQVVIEGVDSPIVIQYGDPLTITIRVRDKLTGAPVSGADVSLYLVEASGDSLLDSSSTDSQGYATVGVSDTWWINVGNYTLKIKVWAGFDYETKIIELGLIVIPEDVIFEYLGGPVEDYKQELRFVVKEDDGEDLKDFVTVRIYSSNLTVISESYTINTFYFYFDPNDFEIGESTIRIGFSVVSYKYNSSIKWLNIPHKIPIVEWDLPNIVEQGETISFSINVSDQDLLGSIRLRIFTYNLVEYNYLSELSVSVNAEVTIPIEVKPGWQTIYIEIEDLAGHKMIFEKNIFVEETKIIIRYRYSIDGNELTTFIKVGYSSGYDSSRIKIKVYYGKKELPTSFNGTYYISKGRIFGETTIRIIAYDDLNHKNELSFTVNYSSFRNSNGLFSSKLVSLLVKLAILVVVVSTAYLLIPRIKRGY